MVLGEIDAALSIWDRCKNAFKKSEEPEQPAENVATRFVTLFEKHGVHRNQIPRFFGHGLHVSHLKTDEELLSHLDEDILDAASELFAVRREWLDGADYQIYPLHDFYKSTEKFVDFIEQLGCEKGTPDGVLLTSNTDCHGEDAILILEEGIGSVGDKPIYRYHLCNNWYFTYWKSRAYLSACIAAAWKRNIPIMGRAVDFKVIQLYSEGLAFLPYTHGGALPTEGLTWHPEDMCLRPDIFLEGLSEGDFGRHMGLELWLQLEESGFMDVGISPCTYRKTFEQALSKYKGS